MKPTILAMDLEATLISNAVSQIPRPGLFPFLEYVRANFTQLVIFTSVPQSLASRICGLLVTEGVAPAWFAQLPYVDWNGPTKDLRFVASDMAQVLLLDDHAPYVHPGQESHWVEIPLFGSPYADDDTGLDVARLRIDERLSSLSLLKQGATHLEWQRADDARRWILDRNSPSAWLWLTPHREQVFSLV